MQNSMPEIKHPEMRRRGQHVRDTSRKASLCAGRGRDPLEKLNMVSGIKTHVKSYACVSQLIQAKEVTVTPDRRSLNRPMLCGALA